MTVVGECNATSHRRSKFQKEHLEQISQVDGTTIGRTSGERVYSCNATKGERLYETIGLNSQVKGQRRVEKNTLPFSVLFCVQKRVRIPPQFSLEKKIGS